MVTSLLALAGCTDATRTGARGERPIELLVPTDAETLDPRYATDAVAMRVTRLVHAGLFALDPDTLAPRPLLAKSYAFEDPRTLHVTLRDDARFQSGKLLDAEDVRATLLAFGSPRVASRHARVVEAIAGVEVLGPHELRIRLARDHATLLTDLELPILRADQASMPPQPEGSLDGLGPFVVRQREPGSVTLIPAPGPTPPRHAVVIRTVHDENARALRMHAGRADLVINGISPTLLPSFDGAPGLKVSARSGANLTYLLMRTDRAPLDDVRLRRALSLAIDRATIAHTLLADRASVATTLLPDGHWAQTPMAAEPFDPAGARALVQGIGTRRLTLLTSTDRLRGTIARLLAQELADVGIELEVVPLELGTLIHRLGEGDFQLATLQLPELTEPNVLRVFLHSSQVPPNGANRGRVRDDEVDRLLDEGDRLLDPARRIAVYAELEKRVRQQALLLPLWHEQQVVVASERGAAFQPSAEGRWASLATLP